MHWRSGSGVGAFRHGAAKGRRPNGFNKSASVIADMKTRWGPTASIAALNTMLSIPPVVQQRVSGRPIKESNMKNLLAAITLIFVAGVLAGCNTIQGAGKDIERGGEKIQDTARDVQKRM